MTSGHADLDLKALQLLPTVHIHQTVTWFGFSYLSVASSKATLESFDSHCSPSLLFSLSQIDVLNKYLFLTSKPMIYLVNLSEKDYIRKKNKWWVPRRRAAVDSSGLRRVLQTLISVRRTFAWVFVCWVSIADLLTGLLLAGTLMSVWEELPGGGTKSSLTQPSRLCTSFS